MREFFMEWLAGEGAAGLRGARFVLGTPLGTLGGLLLLLVVLALVLYFYPRQLSGMTPAKKRLLTGLRAFTVVLALFLLLNPALEGFRFDPRENYLLMMFDDSASMAIAAEGAPGRGERLRTAYTAAIADFEEPLSQRYQLARYAFGDGVQRIRGLGDLSFTAPESGIQDAVTTALRDFQGINVSAVLVFSDGVEQPAHGKIVLDGQVPVITIAVGGSQTFRDLELDTVNFTRAQGSGTPVRLNLAFQATGFSGTRAIAEVLYKGRVEASNSVQIETDDERHELRLEFKPGTEGWLEYQVRVRPGGNAAGLVPTDEVEQNNSAAILVDNRRKNYRVFYFSGRPNWENKFVQAALKEDRELDLTSVLRISAAETTFVYRGKQSSLVNPLFEGFYQDEVDQPRYDESVFLRFGGDRTLAGRGFPEDTAEMFANHVLILGEVEANFFSQEQLELVREFVRKRGGVLLMLGGPHSFSEGNYQGTVLAGILPVLLNKRSDRDGEVSTSRFKVVPTMEGLLAGTWNLHPSPDKNRELWEELPQLAGLNQFPLVRPHASTLALAEAGSGGQSPLFAMVRYGEGRTAVLATGSTWQWHMGTDKDDDRHGRFWRQMVRGLASDVEAPVKLREKKDHYVVGKSESLEILVRDKLFNERTSLQTRLSLTAPDGSVQLPGVEESIRETGLYRVGFSPKEPGTYQLKLTATDENGEAVGMLEEALLVTQDRREFRHARANPKFLARLAEATGGSAFDLSELKQVTDKIPFDRHDEAERVRLAFWHFPPFFFLLVAAMTLEWYLRRKGGHA